MPDLYSRGLRLVAVVAILASAPAVVVAQDAGLPAAPAGQKITDKNHPDFMRCKSESIIGTRARVRRVCLTNRQWAEASLQGNQLARDVVTNSAAGGMNTQ